MSGVSPSLAPCLAGAIAGGQTTAILGVPFVCAASSTERRETHPHGASAADRLNSIEVRARSASLRTGMSVPVPLPVPCVD